MFLLKNHVENEAGRLVPDPFWFSKKDFYEVKASVLQLSFNIIDSPSTLQTVKRNCIKL